MKKFIAMAALAMLVFSCSDDDTNEVTTSVEGTWMLTSFELNQGLDINGDGEATTDMIAESECFGNSTITFNNDDTATVNFEEIDIEIEQIEGTNDYDITVECLGSTAQETIYTVSGDNTSLTFQYEDGSTETLDFTISGNTLTVVVPELSDLPISDNDDDIAYSFVGATLVFTKQ
ncbi:lipocalin family protein [Flavobacterium suaedae]|nr:lipocalin family protein [Flavobacterium suaedae]